MADENNPTTPPAEAPAPTPNRPTGEAGGAEADPAGATAGTTGGDVDAVSSETTGGDPQTEADIDGLQGIDPSAITTRETADAYSQTVPLDVATLDEIADHVDEAFAPEVRRFMNTHPGVRHMVTVAVHAQGEIVHAFDVKADLSLARDTRAEADRLEQYLRNRFGDLLATGRKPVDIVIEQLDKLRPRSAAESGLAAATSGR